MKSIIDVSHHQGNINWQKVSETVGFAFMKATQGVGFIDSMVKVNAPAAKAAGIKISYYHYATLNTPNVISDAQQEARHFISVVKNLPPFDLPLVLDIEENKALLKPTQVQQWINAFLNELDEAGFEHYILYSYTPFLNDNLPINHLFGGLRLWIAAYVNKPMPTLPKGWAAHWLWQYSAKGKIPGITGDVDMNKPGAEFVATVH